MQMKCGQMTAHACDDVVGQQCISCVRLHFFFCINLNLKTQALSSISDAESDQQCEKDLQTVPQTSATSMYTHVT